MLIDVEEQWEVSDAIEFLKRDEKFRQIYTEITGKQFNCDESDDYYEKFDEVLANFGSDEDLIRSILNRLPELYRCEYVDVDSGYFIIQKIKDE